MVSAATIPKEQAIFSEVWQVLKECYPTQNETDWPRIHERAADVVAIAGKDPALCDLAEGLFLTIAAYVEAKAAGQPPEE